MVKVEIEVTNLDEVDEALQLDPDALLLDNMDLPALRAAVKEVAGRVSPKPPAASTSKLYAPSPRRASTSSPSAR